MPEEKIAIVILSDPRGGNGEEALGRLFNGLASAYEYKQAGDEVTVLFQGAGTRWLEVVGEATHPVHDLFEAVRDKVAGASCGCAEVFGASDSVAASGFELIKDNPVPGTPGLPSLRTLSAQGYRVMTF